MDFSGNIKNDPFGAIKLGRDLAKSSARMGRGLSTNPFGQRTQIKRDSKRTFSKTVKNHVWNNQNGKCKGCRHQLKPSSTHYDHIKAWEDGGKSTEENCQALCANCHMDKTNEDRLKKQKKKRAIKQQGFGWGL
jgi:5-methylcytosine-specific restriction endonuclease McrA